jgi:hypothetical protein
MAIALYFDVHVDHAIAAQLRLRQVIAKATDPQDWVSAIVRLPL